MDTKFQKLIIVLLFLCFGKTTLADWKFKANGEFGTQGRVYENDNLDNTKDRYFDLLAKFKFKTKNYKFWAKLDLESRNVLNDSTSSNIYVKEAWIGWLDKSYQLKLGANYFTWSSLEVFHPIEIINSQEQIDQTKIGEPMLMLEFPFSRKRLNFYLMPLLTDNIYPGANSRTFNFSLAEPWFVKGDDELYDSRSYLGAAIHWRHSLNSLDYNLIFYSGPDKNLQLIAFDGSEYHSLYFITNMLALNLQATLWDTSLKLELLRKSYQHKFSIYEPKAHTLLAAGWEYPYSFLSGSEIFFLLEIQKALGLDADTAETYYIFQNDLFLGFRFSFNDSKAREFTFGLVHDLSREKENYSRLKYSQRINSRSTMEFGWEAIVAPQKASIPLGLERLDGQNYVYTKWNYFY